MEWVEPNITLIASTGMEASQAQRMRAWAQRCANGGNTVFDRRPSHNGIPAQDLIEAAGRRCYNSFAPHTHANVTKIRESQSDFIDNILKQGHGSVLEHASASFAIEGVSRIFTHELVRHRIGSFSQESMRYVALDSLKMPLTPQTRLYLDDQIMETLIGDATRASEASISMMRDRAYTLEGYDPCELSKIPFAVKKKVTSWVRRFALMGVGTGLVYTANMRTLRYVTPLRTSEGAEEEIRDIFVRIGRVCKELWPDVFGDFALVEADDGGQSWISRHEKV